MWDLVNKIIFESASKVLVFAYHIAVVDELKRTFYDHIVKEHRTMGLEPNHNVLQKKSILVKGALTHAEREEAFNKFKTEPEYLPSFFQ